MPVNHSAFQKTMKNKFLKNTSWIIGGQIIKSLVGFVISILTAKYLGPSNYGIIGYVTTIITVFTALSNLGLNNIIVKELIADREKSGQIIGTAITLQLISSAVAYFVVFGTVVVLNRNDTIMWLCALLQSGTLVLASFDHITYYYQSRLESKYPTIISLVAYILMQLYKVYLLVAGKSILWFAFSTTLDSAVVAICMIFTYVIQKGARWKFSLSVAKILLRQSLPFVVSGTISVLYSSLDKIMLKAMLGSTESVGYYNVAYTISHAWVFVIAAIITSFTPLIYEAHGDKANPELYRLRARQLYCMVFWISTAASVAIDVIAPFFIPFFYGESYIPSVIPTMLLTWNIAFAYLGTVRSAQLICEEKQKFIMIFAVTTVLLNAGMNALLIPRFEASGAAFATIVSEFFVCILAPMFFKKTRQVSFDILRGICFRQIEFSSIWSLFKQKIFKKQTVSQAQDPTHPVQTADAALQEVPAQAAEQIHSDDPVKNSGSDVDGSDENTLQTDPADDGGAKGSENKDSEK